MKFVSAIVTTLLILNLSLPLELRAQNAPTHIVSSEQLRGTLVARSTESAANIEEIQKLLSHREVRELVGALADLNKIEQAIPTLDEETLAHLAAESRQVNDQIQAGIPTLGWVLIVVGVFFAIMMAACAGSDRCSS